MAATGLLGINPYYKGVNLDISSKPTQLAIQLQQKERAKAEAYEKYFMDYEKSLNPAGLAQGESREFLNKFNKIKENWIKNKDAILHPAKYGYDAQAEHSALLKDAVSYIDLGKKATAERTAYNKTLDQERKAGKHIIGDLEVTNDAMKTVGLGYVPPDMSRIEIFDPHDVVKYKDQLRNVTKNPGSVTTEKLPNGITERTLTTFVPDINELKGIAFGTLQKRGAQEYADQLLNNPSEIKRLSEVYSKTIGGKMPLTREGVFLAHTIEEAPTEIRPGGERETEAYQNKKFLRSEAGKNKRADLAAAATANAAGGSIDDYINASDTKKVIPENTTLTELTFGPKVADEYIVKKTVPKDAVQYQKMEADENAPYETKTVNLTPRFGKNATGDVFVAYSTLDKNGKETGKYDWKNATPLTADVRSTILNKVAGSKFKVTALEGKPSKKETLAERMRRLSKNK